MRFALVGSGEETALCSRAMAAAPEGGSRDQERARAGSSTLAKPGDHAQTPGNPLTTGRATITVEEWAASYGSPYLIAADDAIADAALIEDGVELQFHAPAARPMPSLAFVDGVRRIDARLWIRDGDRLAGGAAGSHACGAVLAEPGERLVFGPVQVDRLAIAGGGLLALLPSSGGFHYRPVSIAGDDPDGPLMELQSRMRQAEGRLAEELADAGRLVIVDGPLNYVRCSGPACGRLCQDPSPCTAGTRPSRTGSRPRTRRADQRVPAWCGPLRVLPAPRAATPLRWPLVWHRPPGGPPECRSCDRCRDGGRGRRRHPAVRGHPGSRPPRPPEPAARRGSGDPPAPSHRGSHASPSVPSATPIARPSAIEVPVHEPTRR